MMKQSPAFRVSTAIVLASVLVQSQSTLLGAPNAPVTVELMPEAFFTVDGQYQFIFNTDVRAGAGREEAFAEFSLGGFGLASEAFLNFDALQVHQTDNQTRLAAYAGDGVESLSDYGRGTEFAAFIYYGGALESQSFSFDVTTLFNEAILSAESHLGVRFFGTTPIPVTPNNDLAQARFRNAVLLVSTPVPEPIGRAILAPLIALCARRRSALG